MPTLIDSVSMKMHDGMSFGRKGKFEYGSVLLYVCVYETLNEVKAEQSVKRFAPKGHTSS